MKLYKSSLLKAFDRQLTYGIYDLTDAQVWVNGVQILPVPQIIAVPKRIVTHYATIEGTACNLFRSGNARNASRFWSDVTCKTCKNSSHNPNSNFAFNMFVLRKSPMIWDGNDCLKAIKLYPGDFQKAVQEFMFKYTK